MSHLRAHVSGEEADVMSRCQIVFAGQDAECRMSCTDTVSLGLMRAPIAKSGEDADRGAVQWTVQYCLGIMTPFLVVHSLVDPGVVQWLGTVSALTFGGVHFVSITESPDPQYDRYISPADPWRLETNVESRSDESICCI